MFRKILVANDGSDGAKRAVEAAVEMAKRFEAELHSISVEQDLPHYAATVGEVVEAQEEANAYFRRVAIHAGMIAESHGVRLTSHVLPGHEVETIVTFAKEQGFDLLVIGFMGHSKLFGRFWGSTSQNIATHSPCTVMIVK